MRTVFSHVIQSHFSRQNENVATEALCFILNQSASARNQFMNILRELVPDVPSLAFRTQQQAENTRPDIAGSAGGLTRILIENKFWAGLTDHQPVDYIRSLSTVSTTGALVFIVPEARSTAITHELSRRVRNAEIDLEERSTKTFEYAATTSLGVVIAVTTWTKTLDQLMIAASEEPARLSDISQLRALCEASDAEAFVPVSDEELTDQRTPAFILQLGSLVDEITQKATAEGIVNTDGLRPQSSQERIGRYIRFPKITYFWFGLHFEFWRRYGVSPLWMVFYDGQGVTNVENVVSVLDEWIRARHLPEVRSSGAYGIPVPVETNVEKDEVVDSILQFWRDVRSVVYTITQTNQTGGHGPKRP